MCPGWKKIDSMLPYNTARNSIDNTTQTISACMQLEAEKSGPNRWKVYAEGKWVILKKKKKKKDHRKTALNLITEAFAATIREKTQKKDALINPSKCQSEFDGIEKIEGTRKTWRKRKSKQNIHAASSTIIEECLCSIQKLELSCSLVCRLPRPNSCIESMSSSTSLNVSLTPSVTLFRSHSPRFNQM